MIDRDEQAGGRMPTIVARATPDGVAGLAVVRLSGPEAVAVARRVFAHDGFRERCRTHRAYHGPAVAPGGDADEEILDEVVVLPMRAPRSYTGEDTVEFYCHGGAVPAQRLLEACLAAGARPAGPGEFTRRAFLNGKLSLDRAEAVADLIHAESELTASAALGQLRGGLDRELAAIEEPLRRLLAELEGSLEFVEEEGVAVPRARVLSTLESTADLLEGLLSLARAGRHLRRGVHVVLVGPPNVGKSSLLNALAGEDRVIVDGEAGTTRDVVSVPVRRPAGTFVLHDTAGLAPDGGRLERLGMARTRHIAATADILLRLREAAREEREPGAGPGDEDASGEGQVVLDVLTKADTLGHPGVLAPRGAPLTSALRGTGIEELWERLEEAAGLTAMRQAAERGVLLNERHKYKLMNCLRSVRDLCADCASGLGDEVTASLLAAILAETGEISGRVFSESLLEEVFSRFCVGK